MTFRSRTIRLAALFLIALASARFTTAQDAPSRGASQGPLQSLDEYVNKARADWEVPGLAIAVVKDDKVVFAKGFGVRKLGDPAPVNERTLFAIGSAGKAFTASGSLAQCGQHRACRFDQLECDGSGAVDTASTGRRRLRE